MEFEIKLYDWTWKFKKQINPKKEYEKISFQEELYSGQWNLSLLVEGDLSNYSTSDIIEIKTSTNWNLYTWIIEDIWVREFENSSILQLKFLWVFTALNDVIFKDWLLRTFNVTDTVGNIIKLIVDSFNADYGNLFWDTKILQNNLIRYTWSSIDITWSTISIDFDENNCLLAIQRVIEDTWFNFYIWKDWIIFVTQKINQEKKYITFEKEILSIKRDISKKDMVNKYYLARSWWTYKTYEDLTYQWLFWLKEKSKKDEDINEATQDLKWDEYIEENKEEDNIVSIKIKPNSIAIIPWDIITTLNSRNNLIEKQITKIDISKEEWEIYLWNFVSFWKTIVKGT